MHRILEKDGNLAAQGVPVQLPQVHAIEEIRPASGS